MSSRPVCVRDIETEAKKKLDRGALGYYASGADQEQTLEENREAFKRWYLIPRMLKDISNRCLKTTVLGQEVEMPIGTSPTSFKKLAHPDGDIGSIRATSSLGTLYTLSTTATSKIEEVAAAAPEGLRWFQLYVYKDREMTANLVRRAEASGYSALVLTVDCPLCGKRLADERNKFSLPPHIRLENFESKDNRTEYKEISGKASANEDYTKVWFDQSLTWKDIAWLKQITSLPIVVKGIMCAEDALLCLQYGASAIMVSNHGGRQVDGVPPTIEALPEIVEAVAGRCEVYIDGGVTQGTDVLKALALGARMVFIGRPVVWGLAYDGEAGVRLVLEILRNELELNMALTGCSNITEITPALLRRRETYSKM